MIQINCDSLKELIVGCLPLITRVIFSDILPAQQLSLDVSRYTRDLVCGLDNMFIVPLS